MRPLYEFSWDHVALIGYKVPLTKTRTEGQRNFSCFLESAQGKLKIAKTLPIHPLIFVKKINSNKLRVGPPYEFSWDHVASIGYKVPITKTRTEDQHVDYSSWFF